MWMTWAADAAKRWRCRNGNKPQPKHWLGHVRVAGLKQRDGSAVVIVLPTRLVPPESSPPVEGRQELKSSGLMNHVDTAHGKKTLLHSDEAQAWPKLVADVGKNSLESHHVNHSKHEFARSVSVKKGARKRPACFIVGTQCIDRWWQTLQDFIPTQLHSYKGKEANRDFFLYMHSFVWRHLNCNKANKHLGFLHIAACKQCCPNSPVHSQARAIHEKSKEEEEKRYI